MYLLDRGERANAVRKGSFENVHKTIQKTVMMDYSLSKVEDFQLETFLLKTNCHALNI